MADETNTGADAGLNDMLSAMNVQIETMKSAPEGEDAAAAEDSSGAGDEGTIGEGETTETGEGDGDAGDEGQAAEGDETAAAEEATKDPVLARLEALEAELAAAKNTITELSKPKEERDAPVEPPPAPVTEWQSMEFVGEDFDIDNLTHETFNEILNAVASKAFTIAKEAAATETMLKIPDIVRNNVQLHTNLNRALDKFYAANKDLVEHRKVVMAEAEKIVTAEPSLGIDELFKKAGEAARKTLKLVSKAQPAESKTTRAGRSGLTDVNNQRQPESDDDNLSKFDKEVDAMIKAINPII